MPEIKFDNLKSRLQAKPELITPTVLTALPINSEFIFQFGDLVSKEGIENKIWISSLIEPYFRIYPNISRWDGSIMYFTPANLLISGADYILHTSDIDDSDGGRETDTNTAFNTITYNGAQLISPNKQAASLYPAFIIKYSEPLNPSIDKLNSVKIQNSNGTQYALRSSTTYSPDTNITQTLLESGISLTADQSYTITVNVTSLTGQPITQSFVINTQKSTESKMALIQNEAPQITSFRQSKFAESGLLVFYAEQPDSAHYGIGGSFGADELFNRNQVTKPPVKLCHGSCIYKALIGWDDGRGNGRFACNSSGCGSGHSQDWVLRPNQEYAVVYYNPDPEDYPNSSLYSIHPFAITTSNAIIEGHLLSPLFLLPNMNVWTGLTGQWTAAKATNTCGGSWGATIGVDGQPLSGQVGIAQTLLVSQLINHHTAKCATEQASKIFGNANAQWHYGLICVEQPK